MNWATWIGPAAHHSQKSAVIQSPALKYLLLHPQHQCQIAHRRILWGLLFLQIGVSTYLPCSARIGMSLAKTTQRLLHVEQQVRPRVPKLNHKLCTKLTLIRRANRERRISEPKSGIEIDRRSCFACLTLKQLFTHSSDFKHHHTANLSTHCQLS